jgi:aconitase B
MPLDMPKLILVRFKGKMHLGITLRDLVHAIPLYRDARTLERSDRKMEQCIVGYHYAVYWLCEKSL